MNNKLYIYYIYLINISMNIEIDNLRSYIQITNLFLTIFENKTTKLQTLFKKNKEGKTKKKK